MVEHTGESARRARAPARADAEARTAAARVASASVAAGVLAAGLAGFGAWLIAPEDPIGLLGMAPAAILACAVSAGLHARRLARLARAARERELSLERRVSARAEDLSAAYNKLADEQDAVRRELRVAREIQGCIVGRLDSLPPRPELAVGAWYQAMDAIGGDLYDVVRIGRNAYGFLMADVAGHGIPAALITALVKVAFDGKASWGVRPEGVCDAVNRVLCQLVAEQDRFVTAWYGILDLESGRLVYTNAGHHPPLLRRADASMERPDTECPPLGIFEDAPYYSAELRLSPGDRILLFTDGIVEARNYFNEQYGYARLLSEYSRSAELDPQAQVSALVRDVDSFVAGAPASDDRAMLAFEFRGFAAP